MGKRIKDLTGERYSRLVVTSFNRTERKHAYWNVKCDCGNMDIARSDRLLQGTKKSCGCLLFENNKSDFKLSNVHFLGREWEK